MTEPNSRDGPPVDPGEARSVSADVDPQGGLEEYAAGDADIAPSEAFQTLASEVRVAVLVVLLRAEREDAGPRSFSELQERAGSDSSAGFAYHLRQLSGHFVRKTAEGYVLTPAGRRAAEAVLTGTFTNSGSGRAS